MSRWYRIGSHIEKLALFWSEKKKKIEFTRKGLKAIFWLSSAQTNALPGVLSLVLNARRFWKSYKKAEALEKRSYHTRSGGLVHLIGRRADSTGGCKMMYGLHHCLSTLLKIFYPYSYLALTSLTRETASSSYSRYISYQSTPKKQYIHIYRHTYIGLAKAFFPVFPWDITEKPKQTFWPT